MNSRIRTWKIAAASLALAASVAQAQQVQEFEGVYHSYPWPAELSSPGPFTRSAAGDVDGDSVPDVIVLDGTQPVVFFATDEWFCPMPSSVVANDLAFVRPSAGIEVGDLAVAGPGGLWRVWYQASTESLASINVDSGAWAGAKVVVAADTDGDGDDDLVGIAADGTTVLRKQNNGASGFSSLPSYVAASPATDVVALQWDYDTPLEIALLCVTGVDVLDHDGSPTAAWTHPSTGGAIARLRQVGQPRDRLVWVTVWAPPAQQLLMVLAQGGASDVVDLGALDTVAIECGDYDLDNDDDLMISHRFSHELIWLRNERTPSNPNGPSFSANPDGTKLFRVGPPQTGAPQNDARPLLRDLDQDGDLDVFFAVESSMEIEVMRGEAHGEASYRPSVPTANFQTPSGSAPGVLTLQIAPPVVADTTQDELEVELWRKASVSTWIDQDRVARVFANVPTSGTASVALDIPETTATFLDVYLVQVRTVDRNAQGEVVARGVPRNLWFATDQATALAIQAMQGSEPPLTVWSPGGGPGAGGGGAPTGQIMPRPKVDWQKVAERARREHKVKPPPS